MYSSSVRSDVKINLTPVVFYGTLPSHIHYQVNRNWGLLPFGSRSVKISLRYLKLIPNKVEW